MNRTPILFLNVLVIAACGLVYELLAGTLASYVLGDSVRQFSLIIGIYLSAMGLGAWLSRFLEKDLARRFIEVELAVALIGGVSAPLLFLSFAQLSYFSVVLYGMVGLIGTLVGLELPLLMRILQEDLDFKDLVSRVLTFDYIGALVAALLFPLFLVPELGLVRTSLTVGLCNAAVGLWATWVLAPLLHRGVLGLRVRAVLVMVILTAGIIQAETLTRWSEEGLFVNRVIYAQTTPYQRIVLTRQGDHFQLFLNGHLQFNSADEYRYHEALVHPPMACFSEPRRVLILGGGDGLALREVLKYPTLEHVTLVDLDPGMTQLADRVPLLAQQNNHAFDDERVEVINRDAYIWVDQAQELFDVAIIDFPDPSSFALGKLYTTRFFHMLRQRLSPNAAVAMQCTSPLLARSSYWCIVRTLEAADFYVHPYHAAVPSFGVWGFCLAKQHPFDPPSQVTPGIPCKFLNAQLMPALFHLPADLQPVDVQINQLNNQILVRYHASDWGTWD